MPLPHADKAEKCFIFIFFLHYICKKYEGETNLGNFNSVTSSFAFTQDIEAISTEFKKKNIENLKKSDFNLFSVVGNDPAVTSEREGKKFK